MKHGARGGGLQTDYQMKKKANGGSPICVSWLTSELYRYSMRSLTGWTGRLLLPCRQRSFHWRNRQGWQVVVADTRSLVGTHISLLRSQG